MGGGSFVPLSRNDIAGSVAVLRLTSVILLVIPPPLHEHLLYRFIERFARALPTPSLLNVFDKVRQKIREVL